MIQGLKKNLIKRIYNGDNQICITSIRYLPRWIVVIIDVLILVFSLTMTHFILLNLNIRPYDTVSIYHQYIFLLTINIIFFFVFRTYSGLIRHSSHIDIIKLLLAATFTLVAVLIINQAYLFTTGDKIYLMPGLVFYAFFSFSFLLIFRLLVKQVFRAYKGKSQNGSFKKRIFIYGTSDEAISIAEALQTESVNPFEIVGFLVDNKSYKNLRILDRPVVIFKKSFFDELQNYNIYGLLIIENSLSIKQKIELVDECLKANVQIYNVPRVEKLQQKKDINAQIRAIEIEDLLNREEINLDNENIRSTIFNKTILITGGAGSIGSEIARQVIKYNPKQIVILDQAESPLHELELQLIESFPNVNLVTELANISNINRLDFIFEKYEFDLIYHAAAYKHVPMIERNPYEAINVNILGTMNLVKLAISSGVERFVMVSTDKAVNPTNVMGASKRAAEMYVQSIQAEKGVKTKFITTRFGNVLGSNGSVIPHFKRQIAKGGPITVTHPDIIRYFMTITEACQLVVQAGSMGNGGEVFVFDMGKPVRIKDLAIRMIKLSGLKPEEDIKIEITGLRTGEKLFEELLANSSTTLPTHHKKILIAKDDPLPFNKLKPKFDSIVKTSIIGKDQQVVKLLKEIVVEFKSENSIFKCLDS